MVPCRQYPEFSLSISRCWVESLIWRCGWWINFGALQHPLAIRTPVKVPLPPSTDSIASAWCLMASSYFLGSRFNLIFLPPFPSLRTRKLQKTTAVPLRLTPLIRSTKCSVQLCLGLPLVRIQASPVIESTLFNLRNSPSGLRQCSGTHSYFIFCFPWIWNQGKGLKSSYHKTILSHTL